MMNYQTPHQGIVIFGAGGNGAAHLRSLKPHVRMAGFVDNDPNKRGTHFCGHPVHSAADIINLNYTNIFIASSWALDITSQLVRDHKIHNSTIVDYTLKILFDLQAAKKKPGKRILVTGNSYSVNAYHAQCFEQSLINLAMSSQDLATDFALLRFALENSPQQTVSHVLIGLYHYIFDYEYTKRKEIDTEHVYSFLRDPTVTARTYTEHFTPELSDNILNSYVQTITPSAIKNALRDAQRRSAREYPLSRKSNVETLEKMVIFLKDNNIKPIFVIQPMHASYTKNIEAAQLQFFYGTLQEISVSHAIPVLDRLHMKLPDMAFGDATHLNRFGSHLFSTEAAGFLRQGG